jgi:transposase
MKHRRFRLNDDELRAIEARERETREALELRRLQGVRLYGSGLEMQFVQQVTGAARRTVGDWVKAYQTQGLAGLKPGWTGGNNRKLSTRQREELYGRLQQLPTGSGLTTNEPGSQATFWSVEAVEQVVEQWYGVRYRSRESYRMLLVNAGFSFQQPESIYRSRPSEVVIADFEATAEKK